MREKDPVTTIMLECKHALQIEQPLSDLDMLMSQKGVKLVPILDGKKLEGIVSFTDLFQARLCKCAEIGAENSKQANAHMKVIDIMRTDVETIHLESTIGEAASKLQTTSTLPVIDDGQYLLGLVTREAVINYLRNN